MSDEEVLRKAIEKAIAGGWKLHKTDNITYELFAVYYDKPMIEVQWLLKYNDSQGEENTVRDIQQLVDVQVIYSHSFAKALWGTEVVDWIKHIEGTSPLYLWKYHLRKMVTAPDPIAYLKENI